MSISISAINDPPVLTVPGAQTIAEGKLLTFTVSATDPDSTSLIYSASGLPTGATFNPSTRTFSWTPGYTQNGAYSVTFTASDGTAQSSNSVSILVTDVNAAPIAYDAAISVAPGATYTGSLKGVDPDGRPVTFTIVSNGKKGTARLTNASTGAFTYTAQPKAKGGDSFTFRVSDGTLNSAIAKVTVTIK